MWVPKDIRVEPNEPPFVESNRALEGQHRLVVDGIDVANLLESVEWSGSLVQLHICSYCGSAGCTGGNYVAVRRAGEYVVLTPAWAEMAEGEWEANEYGPPDAIAARGALALTLAQAEFATRRSATVTAGSPPLTGAELLRIMQHAAPLDVLGKFPDAVTVSRDPMLASSRGDLDVAVSELSNVLSRFTSARYVKLQRRAQEDVEIEFFLDDPHYSTWPAYTASGGLVLAPSLVAFPVVARVFAGAND